MAYHGPQFGKTAYISEVNRDTKVKSEVHVATNKNSDPVHMKNITSNLDIMYVHINTIWTHFKWIHELGKKLS